MSDADDRRSLLATIAEGLDGAPRPPAVLPVIESTVADLPNGAVPIWDADTQKWGAGVPSGDGGVAAPGPQGDPGASAYDLWLAAGNEGDVNAYLASLVGPQGPAGQDGTPGADGAKGDKGDAGPRGAGGELVYGEYVGNNLAFTGAYQDIPGTQVVVPANATPYMLNLQAAIEITATAANGVAICGIVLYDVDNLVALKQPTFRAQIPVLNQIAHNVVSYKHRMPASAVARTFKLRFLYITQNATAVILGPGSNALNETPFLQAVTL